MSLPDKLEYLGAVTLIHFSNNGSLLYVGVGRTVYLYAFHSGHLLKKYHIFCNGIIHGCDNAFIEQSDSIQHLCVFYGQRQMVCMKNIPQTANEIEIDDAFKRVGDIYEFSDWIFDVQILSKDYKENDTYPLVAIGLAHNMICIWNSSIQNIVLSVQCDVICILYSLSFYGRSQRDLVVASGTVFQQILIWDAIPVHEDAIAYQDNHFISSTPSQRLHNHDGVIFKLRWSKDGSCLVSVSDDRTVQLWSNAAQGNMTMSSNASKTCKEQILTIPFQTMFRSWGHSARIWDLALIEKANVLVTASEDGVAKVWDLSTGSCLATLQGHSRCHVWRVAAHPNSEYIATGGGEGAVKLWSLKQQIQSTESINEYLHTITFSPEQHIESCNARKNKSKKTSLRGLAIGKTYGDTAYAILDSGKLFRLSFHENSSELCMDLDLQNTSCMTMSKCNRYLGVGDTSGNNIVIGLDHMKVLKKWKGHKSSVVKIWFGDDETYGGVGNTNNSSLLLFTSSIDGMLIEWELSNASESGNLWQETCVTCYKAPGKAVCTLVVIITKSVDAEPARNLICGDGRGNIFAFYCPKFKSFEIANAQNANSESIDNDFISATAISSSVHGRDQVSSLCVHFNKTNSESLIDSFQEPIVLSGGHDGNISTSRIELDDNGRVTGFYKVSSWANKTISTIKHIWVSNTGDIMVLGFHAKFAILYNVTANYRCFYIACGGWRRPNDLATWSPATNSNVPVHTFVFLPPQDLIDNSEGPNSNITLQYHTTRSSVPLAFAKCSIHDQYHGQTTTTIVKVGDILVTSGNDAIVKLHQRQVLDSRHTVDDIWKNGKWKCIASGMKHTTTVRALSNITISLQNASDNSFSNQTYVISGGGKEQVSIWKVRETSNTPLELVCDYECDGSSQDHRILGISTFSLNDSTGNQLIVTCNSEGVLQFLIFHVEHSRLIEVGRRASASKRPMLCCCGLQCKSEDRNDVAILTIGATDGTISLWNLADLIKLLQDHAPDKDINLLISKLSPTLVLQSHDMGTNCLKLVTHAHSIYVVSGGDDQCLHVSQLKVSQVQRQVTIDVICEKHVINASGSAIKAIACNEKLIFIAGYDQCVGAFEIQTEDKDGLATIKEIQHISSLQSECADIAGIAIFPIHNLENQVQPSLNALNYAIIVAGQGLQVLKF